MMKISLRKRFLIPTLSVIIFGMCVSTMVSYKYSREALEISNNEHIKQVTRLIVKNSDFQIKSIRTDLQRIAGKKSFQWAIEDSYLGMKVRKSTDTFFMDMAANYVEIIGLANHQGKIVSSSNPDLAEKINISNQTYFQNSLKGKEYISKTIKSQISGNPIFVIAVPILTNEQYSGVLFAMIDIIKYLNEFMEPVKVAETGYSYIFEEEGLIVAHPIQKHIGKLNIQSFDFGKKMMHQKEGILYFTHEGEEYIASLGKFTQTNWTVVVQLKKSELQTHANRIRYISFTLAGIIALIVTLIISFSTKRLINSFQKIIYGLATTSYHVSDVSNHLVSIAQELAVSASKQATSIDKSRASLEEINSMTRQNANNASSASFVIKEEVIPNFEIMDKNMKEMKNALEVTIEAGKKTAGVINAIDEITFQINMLALNAAIEASHAGKAGDGFAVVASEVRNLALRTAVLAKDIASLIENSNNKIGESSSCYQKAYDSMEQNLSIIRRVEELFDEISKSCNEEAIAVNQVSQAITHINTVVQKNVSHSHETASASNQMKIQAQQVTDFIEALIGLIKGKKR